MPNPSPGADLLAAYLAQGDVPCPACGYNLRGLGHVAGGDRCPECEQVIELRLEPAEPRFGAFIAGLIGLAAGIGFSLAFMTFAVLRLLLLDGVSRASIQRLVPEFWPLPLNLVLESLLLIGWICARRWLRQRPATTRNTLAAACWVLSVALAAFFFMWLI